MEMEQVNKVVRLDESPMQNEGDVQVKVDDNVGGGNEGSDELSDMDKLPSDILTKILDYLNEKQLVKCRLLSSSWNEICCRLLQDKAKFNSYSRLVVQLRRKISGKNYLACKTTIEKSLDNFIKCFSPSGAENSSGHHLIPFSRFSVTDLHYSNESQMTRFVSTFGQHIKFLTLDIKEQDCGNMLKFWRLLLKFAPNIEHLEINGSHWLNELNLFDSESDSADSFLQKLKSIEISRNEGFGLFDVFLKDLLVNAPNVKSVSSSIPPARLFFIVEGFKLVELLQSCGKPHLLKKLDITPSCQSTLSPVDLMKNLQLEYLRADSVGTPKSVKDDRSTTNNYIYRALESSRDTLTSLNVTMNSIKFCFKDVSSLPNVRRLQITDLTSSVKKRNVFLEQISQICPNVSSLHLGGLITRFSKMAPILWTKFTGVKSLKFEVLVTNNIIHDRNSARTLDSAFSGYSLESIEKIQAKLEEGISLEEARRGEEQNPSILNLTGLSRLELEFFMSDRKEEMEGAEDRLRNSIFIKILPQHIRENPKSFVYRYYN